MIIISHEDNRGMLIIHVLAALQYTRSITIARQDNLYSDEDSIKLRVYYGPSEPIVLATVSLSEFLKTESAGTDREFSEQVPLILCTERYKALITIYNYLIRELNYGDEKICSFLRSLPGFDLTAFILPSEIDENDNVNDKCCNFLSC